MVSSHDVRAAHAAQRRRYASTETTCMVDFAPARSSTSFGGSISTIFIYGFCLLQGANYLADGSEMLLEILDPGLIGGGLYTIASLDGSVG